MKVRLAVPVAKKFASRMFPRDEDSDDSGACRLTGRCSGHRQAVPLSLDVSAISANEEETSRTSNGRGVSRV